MNFLLATALATLTLGHVSGQVGEQVLVPATLSVDEPFAAVQMAIEYDSTAVEFEGATLSPDLVALGYSVASYRDTVVWPTSPGANKVSTVQVINYFGEAAGDIALGNVLFRVKACADAPLVFSRWCAYNQVVLTSPVVEVCGDALTLNDASLTADCAVDALDARSTWSAVKRLYEGE